MSDYYSDREMGPKPRNNETISPNVWVGIVAHFFSLISNGAFGISFPEACPDGCGPAGNDISLFSSAIKAELPDLPWQIERYEMETCDGDFPKGQYAPDTMLVLDFIEFCYRFVAKPIQKDYHDFFRHYHLSFDAEEGKKDFRETINRIFSRNQLAYQLDEEGRIKRLLDNVLSDSLLSTDFNTGDYTLDSMLEESRSKLLNPDLKVRKEALEKLWDCWERVKTLEYPEDKKESIQKLLVKAADDFEFRSYLNDEASILTKIGNSFNIRHSETTQNQITDPKHVDYLFHRLYCLIQLLLSKR